MAAIDATQAAVAVWLALLMRVSGSGTGLGLGLALDLDLDLGVHQRDDGRNGNEPQPGKVAALINRFCADVTGGDRDGIVVPMWLRPAASAASRRFSRVRSCAR